MATLAARGAIYTLGGSIANQAPTISVAAASQISFGDPPVQAVATVSDDGLPAGSTVSVTWTQTAGPAPASLQNTTGLANSISLTSVGTYAFRARASDGAASSDAYFSIAVAPVMQAPLVSAGDSQVIQLPATSTQLRGSVSSVSNPPNDSLLPQWTVDSGPGLVVFDTPSSPVTVAHFSAPGNYLLRLSARESAPGWPSATSSATVSIAVVEDPSSDNDAPFIAISPVPALSLPLTTVQLDAFVTDDGRPSGSVVTTHWQQIDGPGLASIASPSATSTLVTLPSTAGTYRFSLSCCARQLMGS